MFRRILAAALIGSTILGAGSPALAKECEQAAQRVRKEARDAGISAQLAAQVDLAIQRALDRRKVGDEIGCLSGMEAARKIFEAQ